MKSKFFYIIIAVLILVCSSAQAQKTFPKPMGLVNDFAGVIPSKYEKRLLQLNTELLKSTGVPIVSVSMPDIGGVELNSYSTRLYNKWGIGTKGINKGLLFFVTLKERKVRITTGSGIEKLLPNSLCSEILNRDMIPHFKQNNFGEGFFQGAISFARIIAEDSGVKLRFLAAKSKEQIPDDKKGPKLVLLEPPSPRGIKIVHKHKLFRVRGFASDRSGVSWVKVNGMNASIDQEGQFIKEIPVKPGKNNIIVRASDKLDNLSSLFASVVIEKYKAEKTFESSFPTQKRKFYDKSFALMIGINNYNSYPPLEFAVADAKAVAGLFRSSGFDTIVTILDEDATRKRILTSLGRHLASKITRNDRLVIYFAGHGQTEDQPDGGKMGYIVPVDANFFNYFSSAISMKELIAIARRIHAKHILCIMDSCYSGLCLSRAGGINSGTQGYLQKVGSKRVVQIITAGGKGEQAYEEGGHGLFTKYFLLGLKGEADFDKDDVVTGTELGAYLRPKVSTASQNKQTPLFGRLEGEGEFLFFVKER